MHVFELLMISLGFIIRSVKIQYLVKIDIIKASPKKRNMKYLLLKFSLFYMQNISQCLYNSQCLETITSLFRRSVDVIIA